MTRLWATEFAKFWDENEPDKTKPKKIFGKHFWLGILGMVVDGALIGLLIYAILMHSCELCFGTNIGATTFKQCKGYSQILEDGLPPEVINIYTQTENTTLKNSNVIDIAINNSNVQSIG
jgi:hypothetical protein